MREALILDALRTPIGRRDGILKDWRSDDLAGYAMSELLKRNNVKPDQIDDVILGCATSRSTPSCMRF